jgi:archaellum component FlaD/FlaE
VTVKTESIHTPLSVEQTGSPSITYTPIVSAKSKASAKRLLGIKVLPAADLSVSDDGDNVNIADKGDKIALEEGNADEEEEEEESVKDKDSDEEEEDEDYVKEPDEENEMNDAVEPPAVTPPSNNRGIKRANVLNKPKTVTDATTSKKAKVTAAKSTTAGGKGKAKLTKVLLTPTN